MLVWEENGEELPMSISAQEVTVPVDDVKTHTLVLASVVWSAMMATLAPLQTSPLMVEAFRECEVEQEDTRKDHQSLSFDIIWVRH